MLHATLYPRSTPLPHAIRLGLALVLLVTMLQLAAATPMSGVGVSWQEDVGLVNPASADAATVPGDLTGAEWATMQDSMRAAQYQVTWQSRDGQWAYRAPNRAQGFSVAFAPDGFRATGYEAAGSIAWEFGLAPIGYDAAADLTANKTRVAYRWSETLTEWYENRPDGVEHGLTLAAPPVGTTASEVELTFALRGSLTPDLNDAGQALRLRDAAGSVALVYDQLHVYDATRRELPAGFSLSEPTARGESATLSIVIDAAGATYPLTVDPVLHGEVAILRASDAQAVDFFGGAVSISGDTIVVGAGYENGGVGDPIADAGAAYVYERDQGGADNWGEVTILRASDAQDWDFFGLSVSISGDTIVVGAPGEAGGAGDPRPDAGTAYVYERDQGGTGNWGEAAILRASDAQAGDYFAYGVSISGDTIVAGALYDAGCESNPVEQSGSAYVYERDRGGSDSWGQLTILRASDAQEGDNYGGAVANSGDTIVVGASHEGGGAGDPIPVAGAAYVIDSPGLTPHCRMWLPLVMH